MGVGDVSGWVAIRARAPLMLAAGTDLKVTSARLEHSSISITADLYTHVVSEQDRKAADPLNVHVGRYIGS